MCSFVQEEREKNAFQSDSDELRYLSPPFRQRERSFKAIIRLAIDDKMWKRLGEGRGGEEETRGKARKRRGEERKGEENKARR